MGPEGPRGFGPFHPKPKAHAEEEEVPGDESADQNHGRKKHHISRGHPLEDHKRDSKPYGLTMD